MFEEHCSIGNCDVCGKSGQVVVCCSTMGAISLAYCKDCFENGIEPYSMMVSYISGSGHFPEDINEKYRKIVRNSLIRLSKTEEEFIKDVDYEQLMEELSTEVAEQEKRR